MYEDILGHEQAKRQLARAIQSSRIAHAYIFSGPEGIGKKKTAIAFAKAINCASGQGEDNCPSCRKIDKENHPDVEIIRADGQSIKIERIRTLIKELVYKPYEGRKKIAIFDEAERLTLQAMNTFLKTLEEPPKDSLLILVTSHPQVLIPTVRSRCQMVRFLPLSDENLLKLIQEKKGVDLSLARWIAGFSGGSVRKSLEVDPESYRKKREDILGIIEQLNKKDITSLFATSEKLSKNKEELFETLSLMLNCYRENLHNQNLQKPLLPPTPLREIIEQIQHTIDLLKRNINARLAMDNLLLSLAEKKYIPAS